MIPLGDTLLYASLAVSVIALVGLISREIKNIELLNKLVTPAIIAGAGLLTFSYILLTYYFVYSDFAYDYVWQYSSADLPLIYKISGTWAGQQGTYLLWVWVVYLSAAWLALTTKHKTALARRTQIITLISGMYLIIITLVQSPFKLIIERPEVVDLIAKGTLTPDFVPEVGNGLNALLVNFWMTVHPPLMFIGYATMTIPFAAAIVYLLTKEDGWEELGRQWARFTWLFLGMGIAVGGVWAYLVLGWGGFWAWDPVETASFIPWLTLTAFMHAAALHRKNKATFSIAAPILAVVSFILVLYAAIVVRSGIFNSVHAFGDSSTGTLLLVFIGITILVSIILGMRRYFEESEKPEEDRGFWNKTNIFYVTLLLFVVLAFISLWGISFPAFIQLTQGLKVGVASDTKNFFNIWSYPFTIILLLALGFCLNYNEREKEQQKKTLFIVIGLSIITMFLRTETFYVLDHASPFWAREPALYKMIGNISVISIFPSMIYATWSTIQRLSDYLRIESIKPKIKGIGIAIVHFGVVFILLGAIISSNFTQTIESANIPLASKGQLVDIGNGYGVKIIDFSTRSLTETTNIPAGVVSISEIYGSPEKYANDNVKISGKAANVVNVQSPPPVTYTSYLQIDDGTDNIWAATQAESPLNYQEGMDLTVDGFLMTNFKSNSTNMTYDLILFSTPDQISGVAESGKYKVQSVRLEVYQDSKKIGNGVAEYLQAESGSGTFPLVDSSITGTDVYVIFQGLGGGAVPLTLKIIPAVNFAWIGVVLFAIGIILIMAMRTKSRGG
ncbi:MAG: cytochrome c biogenesis protein CcsA [Candidatus Methanoperedens sp.]|nr:cytochrome c biogenesis protein CcsA [Candidatus Methanoperedens sp.]CAG0994820.1 Cytochrome c-type biogenesis protein CcmF [Methanosarcinales archaeon]